MKTVITLLVAALLLGACALKLPRVEDGQTPLQQTTVLGSYQTPDPVLARVIELEHRGVVHDVIVRESFPVQIRLRAPQAVIDELQRIPRGAPSR